jgi:Dockerin type I domain
VQLVDSIQVNGSATDDTITIDFASGFLPPSNGLRIFGTEGNNRLLIQGAGNIDFTDPNVLVSNFDAIELLGDEFNNITVDGLAIQRLSPLSRSIMVKSGLGDRIEIVDPANWRLADPEIIDGRFVIAAQNQGPSGERVQVDSARPYQNFLQRGDANNSGNVSASDALAIIFELNVPVYSDASGNLMDPTSLGLRSLIYLDVNGDGKVTSADALDVINILFQETLGGGGGGAGEELNQTNAESDLIKQPYVVAHAVNGALPPIKLTRESKLMGVPWNGELLAGVVDTLYLQDIGPNFIDEAIADSDFLTSLKTWGIGMTGNFIHTGRIAQALRGEV